MQLAVLVLTSLLLAPTADETLSPAVRAARHHHRSHQAEILAEYSELLRIPNVASDTVNIRRNAEWIRRALAKRGVETRLLELDGAPPLIYGELGPRSASRTLGLYLHYDGQPVDPKSWRHDPWEPVLYSGPAEDGGHRIPFPGPGEVLDPECRLYARAASDDRAPLAALLGALDALQTAEIPLTSRIRLLFEGEEEAGSPHLGAYFELHRDLLDVSGWLICDGPVHQSRRPQLVFGVRGITSLDLTVYGARRSLHSGHYGNWAPNPALMLAQLLASMKDRDGNVVIEGFHDSVDPLTETERRALDAVPRIDAELMHELGLARTEGGAPYQERLLLPSLNVRGLESATVGETARNIVPAMARASLDIRLVQGNDPAAMLDLVEKHIRKQGYHIVREEPDLDTRLAHPRIVLVERSEGYPAARTKMDLPVMQEIIRAAETVAGSELVLLPTLGGSLPLYLFTDVLGQPAVIVPIANHDNSQHAPDENLRLANLWYGIELMAALLTLP